MLFCMLATTFGMSACSKSSTGKACEADGECGANETCKDKVCVAKSSETPATDGGGTKEAPPPKPCTKDADCDGATELCKDGKCAPLPASCKAKEECGASRICKDGKCERPPCRFDDQCPEGQACNATQGKCEPAQACDKNKPCPNGWVCNTCRNVCTVTLGTNKCNEDFNCAGGIDLEWCDKCVSECRPRQKLCTPCVKDEECGDPEDLCLPDQLNPQSGLKFCGRRCVQNTFCAPGFKCKEFKELKYPFQCVPASGDCAKPGECESDADCLGAGKRCDPRSKRCVSGCSENANCPIRDQNTTCTEDSNCKNSKATCQAGTCKVQLHCCRGRCGVPCTSDSECEASESCKEGCCQVEGECTNSRDCPSKQYCDQNTGVCTPGCQTAQDCGLPDPQKNRCRFKCESNKCVEDCRCRNAHLDCTPVKFCPKSETDPNAPCRKPIGPICKSCSSDADCACKAGDDCKYICERRACKSDADCANMPGGATKCYNDRCSTKKVCASDSDCPGGEKCENSFCAEACNNRCVNLRSGARCFTGCDPRGDGTECPSRMSCTELLPQEATGPACKGNGQVCQSDADCPADQKTCGPDGYCTSCARGKVCRGLNPEKPSELICIPMPPTMCADFSGVMCSEAGY